MDIIKSLFEKPNQPVSFTDVITANTVEEFELTARIYPEYGYTGLNSSIPNVTKILIDQLRQSGQFRPTNKFMDIKYLLTLDGPIIVDIFRKEPKYAAKVDYSAYRILLETLLQELNQAY